MASAAHSSLHIHSPTSHTRLSSLRVGCNLQQHCKNVERDILRRWRRMQLVASDRRSFSQVQPQSTWLPAATMLSDASQAFRQRIHDAIPVLDRYLFKELMTPLLVGLAAFTFLGVTIGTASEVAAIWQSGQSPSQSLGAMLAVVVLRVPSYLAISMPMASLLAPLLTFGRLGADSEIVALRACGVTTWRLVWPAIVIFSGATGLHLLLAEAVMPVANRAATETIHIATVAPVAAGKAIGRGSSAGRRRPVVYPEFRGSASLVGSSTARQGLARLFYANSFDGDTMHDVTLIQLHSAPNSDKGAATSSSPSSTKVAIAVETIAEHMGTAEDACCSGSRDIERIVTAKRAQWDVHRGAWVFEAGTEYVLGGVRVHPNPTQQQLSHIQTAPAVGPKKSLGTHPRPATLQSVRRFSTQVVTGLSRMPLELARVERGGVQIDNMALGQVAQLARMLEASHNTRESRRVALRVHQRMALPFACAVFGTLGALLSLRLPRDQKRVGFALTLAIVFAYYTLSVTGASMGQLGLLSPFLGAWLPNIFGSLAALLLLLLSR